MKWYYCLVHNRVEPEKGCANSERLGPYDTEEQAAHAFELARKRNEEWDADPVWNDRWDSGGED